MLREEGLALACELQGKIGEAICHRKREISLMEKLHREALLPQYSEATRAFMLRDRDLIALKERKQIVRSLRERYTQGNGKAIDQAD
ncbi:MAG: hypothetical protein HYX68_11020 [Planctomycetes bacterium]|nr:hypothetical protein [Planctomycetota bacterium]